MRQQPQGFPTGDPTTEQGAKHTPGSWRLIESGSYKDHFGIESDDPVACAAAEEIVLPPTTSAKKADIRLMAAAPDMLAALKRVVEHPSVHLCKCGGADCATSLALAAIAKATGTAPGSPVATSLSNAEAVVPAPPVTPKEG